MKILKILLAAAIIVSTLTSCSIVKKFAGADIDPVQFEKARQAKALEIRYKSADKLGRRIAMGEPITNADVTVYLNEAIIIKLLNQYVGAKGMLDDATAYTIDSIGFKLYNGCAIASLILTAKNSSYDVDVDLSLDCLLAFKQNEQDIELKLEPFNIYPVVTAQGFLSSADEIIQNLIKINLADVGKNFPPLKIPVTFDNDLKIAGTKAVIKDKINLEILSPQRTIEYRIILKEALIFSEHVFFSLNLDKITVK